MKRVPSLVSKTPDAWGTDWREGLSSNEWSHSLGKKVSSKRQERLELESKGFVNERDLAPHFFEDREALRMEKMREQDRISTTYKEGIDKGLTREEAIVQALPAKDCLSGALEKTWDNGAL
jgi:hypothetical protein